MLELLLAVVVVFALCAFAAVAGGIAGFFIGAFYVVYYMIAEAKTKDFINGEWVDRANPVGRCDD